jgi:hypothetical protein
MNEVEVHENHSVGDSRRLDTRHETRDTRHLGPRRSIRFAGNSAKIGLFAGLALLAVAACGTTAGPVTNNTVIQCGAGTKIENGTCVAVATDAGSSGSTSGGGSTSSSGSAVDGAVPVTDAGGVPVDTGVDVDPATQDDPCPVPGPDVEIWNCDAKCGSLHEFCQNAHCPSKDIKGRDRAGIAGTSFLEEGDRPKRIVLRMPADALSIFGECDQTEMLTTEHMQPQPKFAARFAIGFSLPWSQSVPQMVIDPRSYTARIVKLTATNVQPIPVADPQPGSALNKEFTGCAQLKPITLKTETFPEQVPFAFFFYSFVSQPARNLSIDFLPTAKCPGAP